MVNGLGLLLASMRNSRLVLLPGSMLVLGTLGFSGTIFYEFMSKDLRFHKLIPVGGSLTIFGWAFFVLIWSYLNQKNYLETLCVQYKLFGCKS